MRGLYSHTIMNWPEILIHHLSPAPPKCLEHTKSDAEQSICVFSSICRLTGEYNLSRLLLKSRLYPRWFWQTETFTFYVPSCKQVGFTTASTRALWTRRKACVFERQSFVITFRSAAHPKHSVSLLAWVQLKKTFRSLWRKHKEITIHTPAP